MTEHQASAPSLPVMAGAFHQATWHVHGNADPVRPRTSLHCGLHPRDRCRKLRTKKGKAAYARRKAIVGPVFGQIDVAQGGHQLRLRGKVKADFEWTFPLACHNFRELAGSGWTTTQMTTI